MQWLTSSTIIRIFDHQWLIKLRILPLNSDNYNHCLHCLAEKLFVSTLNVLKIAEMTLLINLKQSRNVRPFFVFHNNLERSTNNDYAWRKEHINWRNTAGEFPSTIFRFSSMSFEWLYDWVPFTFYYLMAVLLLLANLTAWVSILFLIQWLLHGAVTFRNFGNMFKIYRHDI